MNKLNNKGFAISTMLYGILTIIVIILMLLLNIMRSSYNKENAATDEIYYYLNKCVSKQIALEKCYKTYNVDPSDLKSCADEYEAYTSCAGKNINTNLDKKYLNTTIIDKATIKGSGIINDPTVTNRFIFVGINPNNYININGETGRIISVEPSGSIKVLLTSAFNSIFDPYTSTTNISGVGRWENSTLYNTFNNKFNSFDKKNYFERGRFYMAVIYNNDSTFDALQKIRSNTDSTEAYFGLPSLEDYLKASENILEGGATYCNLNDTTSYSINDTFINCRTNNWMNSGTCAWTSTGYSGIDEYITYSSSLVVNKTVTTKCNSNMVIYLSRNTTISSSGEGSISNPYIVE